MRSLVLVMVMGCNEYEIKPGPEDDLIPNAPDIVNPIQVDRIVQRSQPVVDVLFVVDNSCSMDAEQAALADNFPAFASWFELSGLDYHIGVTSTDTFTSEAGKLRSIGDTRFIDANTPNAGNIFAQMAVMGTDGNTEERGRDAAFTTLELNRGIPRNEGFYRDEASLHMVFVSDEEDVSTSNPVTRSEFRGWMDNLKSSPDLVTAHAITWIPGQPCPDAWSPGVNYVDYVTWTGGALLNICEEDWAPFMADLGLQSSGLKREFFLTRLPTLDPWTLTVNTITQSEDGQDIVRGFSTCLPGDVCEVEYLQTRNSIVFVDFVPDPLSEVVITYTVRELYDETQTDVE